MCIRVYILYTELKIFIRSPSKTKQEGLRVFMEISDQYSRSAFVRSDTDVELEGLVLVSALIPPKVFYWSEVRSLVMPVIFFPHQTPGFKF